MKQKKILPEMPVIRPPSEWRSLLIRLTRGCRWNRCRFCGIYPHLGQSEFSIRSLNDIMHDIDLLKNIRPRAETAFFGDADPLDAGLDTFLHSAGYLRSVFAIKRLTCYARASTLHALKEKSIRELADAGLNRVHIGLESGDDATLRYHRKGQSARMVREVSTRLKNEGIEISFYVLLGLGGRYNWQNHIINTANVINDTDPDMVRLRRLWLYTKNQTSSSECPLWKKIRDGSFVPQTDEGTVLELRLLVENLDSPSTFVCCDHENNYVQVSGFPARDKQEMLAEIKAFLELPEAARKIHYAEVGSRI